MTKMKPDAQRDFLDKAKEAIFDKTYALNDVLALDDKTKTTIVADLVGITALVTKRVLEGNPSEKLLSNLSRILKDDSPYQQFLVNPKIVQLKDEKKYEKKTKDKNAFVSQKIDQEIADKKKENADYIAPNENERKDLVFQFKDQFEAELREKEAKQNELDDQAMTDMMSDEKEVKAVFSVVANTLGESESQFNPHAVFHAKIACLVLYYIQSDCKEADKQAFKTNFKAAVDSFSLAYRKVGKSEAADYIKAMGVALLGVLVALITSPMLLVSSGHRHWIGTFFAGPETDESKKVQKELGDEFVDGLLPSDDGPNGASRHQEEEERMSSEDEFGEPPAY